MISARPTHCPYCGEEVTDARPHMFHTPPDERDDPPMWEVQVSSASPENFDFDEVKATKLIPCGHAFREEDVEKWADGEIGGSTDGLGARVINPQSPLDVDE